MSSPFPPDENEHPHDGQSPKPEQSDSGPPVVEPNNPEQQPVYVPQPVNVPPGYVPPGAYPPGAYPAGAYPPGYPPPVYPGYKIERFLEPDEPPKGNLPLVILSWLAILAATGFIFVTVAMMQLYGSPTEDTGASGAELMQVNMQGKMLLGQKSLFGGIQNQQAQMDNQIATTIEQLNTGPPETRYCCAILLNEFSDPSAALDQLDSVDELIADLDYKETEDQIVLSEIIRSLMEQYEDGDFDVSDIDKEERAFVEKKLGWIGQLAFMPRQGTDETGRQAIESGASRSLIVLGVGALLMICSLIGGAIAAFTFFAMTASGKIQPSFLARSTRGRIYVETFALWLCGFMGLQLAMGLLDGVVDDRTMLFITPLIFFGSLLVLFWPIMRGISFSQLRTDIGWKMKNPFAEASFGAISYLATLPFMAFSFVFVMLIMVAMSMMASTTDTNELSSVGAAGHPIQEQIAMGDPIMFLGVFITACIAAPIVEETMFRGVLYRHLRDSTWRWSRFTSVILSALVSSLVFASIHPQGMMGIPILTTLAVSFSLVREWRDSLIAPIVMHAINNSMVTCLLFLIL